MKKSQRIRSLKRSILIATLSVGLAGGAAYAVLQSQQNSLTGNTISTATASLQIGLNTTNFDNTHIGFDFNNIIPGGQAEPVDGHTFYLRNAGTTPLSLKFGVNSIPTGASNVDLSKVNILLTPVGTGTPIQSFSLQSLITESATDGLAVLGDDLDVGDIQQYKLQVSMASDAVTGPSASLANIDFTFKGLAS